MSEPAMPLQTSAKGSSASWSAGGQQASGPAKLASPARPTRPNRVCT